MSFRFQSLKNFKSKLKTVSLDQLWILYLFFFFLCLFFVISFHFHFHFISFVTSCFWNFFAYCVSRGRWNSGLHLWALNKINNKKINKWTFGIRQIVECILNWLSDLFRSFTVYIIFPCNGNYSCRAGLFNLLWHCTPLRISISACTPLNLKTYILNKKRKEMQIKS